MPGASPAGSAPPGVRSRRLGPAGRLRGHPGRAAAAAPPEGSIIEVERTVSASGNLSIGNHVLSVGSPLAGQRVTVRPDDPVAHILPGGVLGRYLRLPVPEQARIRLPGARAATTQPPRLPGPFTVKRRVSVRGAIMVGGQQIQVGLPHAGKTAEVTVQTDTYQITVADGITVAAPGKTSRDIKTAQSLRLRLTNRRPGGCVSATWVKQPGLGAWASAALNPKSERLRDHELRRQG